MEVMEMVRGVDIGPWDRAEIVPDTGRRHRRDQVRSGALETVLPPGAEAVALPGGVRVEHRCGAVTMLSTAPQRWSDRVMSIAETAEQDAAGQVSGRKGLYGPEAVVVSPREVMVARGVDGPGWTLEAVTLARRLDPALDDEVLGLMHAAVLG